jgi:hypothetical protein
VVDQQAVHIWGIMMKNRRGGVVSSSANNNKQTTTTTIPSFTDSVLSWADRRPIGGQSAANRAPILGQSWENPAVAFDHSFFLLGLAPDWPPIGRRSAQDRTLSVKEGIIQPPLLFSLA